MHDGKAHQDASLRLLGALLDHPSTIPAAAEHVGVEHFTTDALGTVFSAIYNAWDNGGEISVEALPGLMEAMPRNLPAPSRWSRHDSPEKVPTLAKRVRKHSDQRAAAVEPQDSSVLASAFSAEWLMEQTYPPLQYVIPGLQPEGLSIFAGSPKIGKSWCVLDTALQLATGGDALGTLTLGQPRPVLYLALEDGQRRLQDRLRTLGVTRGPAGLKFLTTVSPEEIVPTCLAFAARHAGEGPVIYLDTLGKTAPQAMAGETDYSKDYRVASALKEVCDRYPGTSLTAVHHTRKANAEDFLDAVSGTQGLAGAADSILVLKRSRTEKTGLLSVTSRDAMEGEYEVAFDGGRWTLPGGLAEAASAATTAKAKAGLGDSVYAAVVDAVHRHPEGIGPAAIERETDVPAKEVSVYLGRGVEAGRVEKVRRGLYAPVGSVGSVGIDLDSSSIPTVPTLPTGV